MRTIAMMSNVAKDGSFFRLYGDKQKYITRPEAEEAVMDLFRLGGFPASLVPLLSDDEEKSGG